MPFVKVLAMISASSKLVLKHFRAIWFKKKLLNPQKQNHFLRKDLMGCDAITQISRPKKNFWKFIEESMHLISADSHVGFYDLFILWRPYPLFFSLSSLQ
jgi:hypothetical protein